MQAIKHLHKARELAKSFGNPSSDILELMDILDEVSDPQTVETVQEGKEAIRRGNAGIPVSRIFRKFREHRK